ncbi:hypothetical protein K435DRAFT_876247 [Dendrothele bispora CBS 962.96]|uniref:Uncharacterized protein n=1 Tax=Dendrothele bispora (strain CBS 962.96) TaxID=1314807 RepID=A0A4S8KSP0_DENBC|nr:hypothetical protein K435DRAFT_876247 [Dendrothele bispora CBS 962.96]
MRKVLEQRMVVIGEGGQGKEGKETRMLGKRKGRRIWENGLGYGYVDCHRLIFLYKCPGSVHTLTPRVSFPSPPPPPPPPLRVPPPLSKLMLGFNPTNSIAPFSFSFPLFQSPLALSMDLTSFLAGFQADLIKD